MRDSILVYATNGLARLAFAGGLAAVLYVAAPVLSGTSRAAIEGSSLPAAIVSGIARVVDGDTLVIGAVRVRLEGIDAPESGQQCKTRWFGTWDAGRAATKALEAMTMGRDVVCQSKGTDAYGRMLGSCKVAGRDINAEMVRQGFAWAFVKYSQAYVGEERRARADSVGIWQRTCEPAWAYRRNRWSAETAKAPAGCAIKGNVSRAGRVYHTPWSPFYDRTRIELARGERWFCSEAEALAAGWQPARPVRH
jgi:endonuclease YncB( thermonuclease family)